MAYVGGVRIRLIRDSIRHLVEESLRQLGWYDAGRAHRPIQIRTEPIAPEEEAAPNIVAITFEDYATAEDEMGSNLAEHRFQYYIDVYGESDTLSLHLASDIKDIISGRFTSLGIVRPGVGVVDFTQSTVDFNNPIFTISFEDVAMNKSRASVRNYERFWWVVSFDVVDHYGGDHDD